jgi:hypothetical protein
MLKTPAVCLTRVHGREPGPLESLQVFGLDEAAAALCPHPRTTAPPVAAFDSGSAAATSDSLLLTVTSLIGPRRYARLPVGGELGDRSLQIRA